MTFRFESIIDALHSAASLYGDRVALSDGTANVTFGELDRTSDDVARGLIGLGVKAGDKIALWIANCPEWVVLWMAALKCGAVVIPVNTRLKPEEVAYVLRQSDARILVTMDECWSIDYLARAHEMIPELRGSVPGELASAEFPELAAVLCWREVDDGSVPGIDEVARRGRSSSLTLLAVDGEAAAIVVYTSGTTGHPKGAVHGHRLARQAHNMAQALHMQPGDVILGHMPFYHIAGSVSAILPAIVTGCTLVTMMHWEPHVALALMEKQRVTHFSGIPTHFIDCVDAARKKSYDLSAIKAAWVGGAPVTPSVVADVRSVLTIRHLQAVYGMTETSGCTVISGHDDAPEIAAENKGRILGDYELAVADANGKPTTVPGTVGEILVRGHIVMLGYYKNPTATAEVLDADGWFHTGDLGFVDADGYLSVTGRAREMFIVGGSNVYPAEVERVVQGHPAVKQAVAFGVPDARLGEIGRVHVQLQDGASLLPEELRAFCKERLADYKVPATVLFVADFPRTATGKIHRAQVFVEGREGADKA